MPEKSDEMSGSNVYHQVTIADGAAISPLASIIGKVSIAKDCTVLDHASIRGDVGGGVVLEEGANIQENCCIHLSEDTTVVVGRGATVGHGAILHGCRIGEESLVGMGSVVMNNAVIGKHCLIGAGSLVTAGTVVPDGCLALGSPARVRRELTEEEVQSLITSRDWYISVGKQMVAEGLAFSQHEDLVAKCHIAFPELAPEK